MFFRRSSLTASEITPRHSGHSISIFSLRVPYLRLALLKNVSSMGLPPRGKVVWDDVDCHVVSSHKICPPVSWRFAQAYDVITFCLRPYPVWSLARLSYFWHVVIFNVVVMLFKWPMFMPLGYVGGHNHAYSFLSNRRFGFVVLHLESRRSSSLGSSFQICWILIIDS